MPIGSMLIDHCRKTKGYFNIAGGFYDDLTKENKATVLKKEKKHSNKDKNKKKHLLSNLFYRLRREICITI